mgnify:CR=1 FL=1
MMLATPRRRRAVYASCSALIATVSLFAFAQKQLETFTEELSGLTEQKAADVADAAVGHETAAAGRKMLELDALAFAQGSHFMSNKRCELPAGSYRSAKKGYEEVHIPALKPKAFADAEKLRPIEELPSWAHPAFAGMKSLNRVQSQVYETAMLSPENMLLCAPTGAGKTNVAMLTILHELGSHRRPDGSLNTKAFKIVYVAPMKALAAEVTGAFSRRLAPLAAARIACGHAFHVDCLRPWLAHCAREKRSLTCPTSVSYTHLTLPTILLV